MTTIDPPDLPPDYPEDLSSTAIAEHWTVTTDTQAVWAMRKLAKAQAEDRRIHDMYAEEIERLELEREMALRGPRRDFEFFAGLLIDYRRRLEADDPKLPKTYKLVGGAITRRHQGERVGIVDPVAFSAWAKDNRPDAVKLTPRVSELRTVDLVDGKVVDRVTGEVVPGTTVIDATETYAVKVES